MKILIRSSAITDKPRDAFVEYATARLTFPTCVTMPNLIVLGQKQFGISKGIAALGKKNLGGGLENEAPMAPSSSAAGGRGVNVLILALRMVGFGAFWMVFF